MKFVAWFRRRKQREQDLDDEIRTHLTMAIRERIERGEDPATAEANARREFGSEPLIKEVTRDMWGWRWLETLLQDLRYGVRQLRRTPALTAVVALSLALGIGANTAIFSLIDAIMLKMLPVKDPQQLVLPMSDRTKDVKGGPEYSGYGISLSYTAYQRLRRQNGVFSSVMGFVPLGFGPESVTVSADGQPSLAGGEMVSGNYFSGLGVPAILGRVLADEDETGARRVTVLSFRYWTRRFGRSPATLGKTITLGGQPYTIVGVASPEFFGVEPGRAPDFWAPLEDVPGLKPWGVQPSKGQSPFTDKHWWWLMIMARLKPGVSQERARAATEVWLRQTLTGDLGMSGADAKAYVAKLEPASRGLDSLRQSFSQPLFVLMSIAGLVLLIACANVAALLLARADGRRREIAVRLAMGASRKRLIRQLLTESLMLAAAGGLCGMAVAGWGARVLLLMMSGPIPGEGQHPLEIHFSLIVAGFAAVVSLLTGILFGLAPALGATRLSLSPALKDSAGSTSHTGRVPGWRLGKSLVVAQVAVSLLLVAGAGLFVRTLLNLEHQNLGFDPHGVLLFGVNPNQAGYEGARLTSLYDRLLHRIQALPGVESASLSAFALMSGWCNNAPISVGAGLIKPDQYREVWWNPVGPDFLETMRIRLTLGRSISERDTAASPHVAVVNQALARKIFGHLDPLGRSFSFGDTFNPKDAYQIVGVVQNAKYTDARSEIPMTAYIPFSQAGEPGPAHFELRTAGNPALFIPAVREAVRGVDSALAVSGVKTQTQQIDDSLVSERFFAQLSSFFGALALLLAAIGLYGTMSYTVGRRTGEIGIRVALGAGRKHILTMVLREAFALVLVGVVLGFPAALAAGRLVANQLFGLKPSDPLTLFAAIALLVTIAGLAAYLPARRAAKVDPMVALRYE